MDFYDDNLKASLIASIIPLGSAIFFPAISYAVPDDGDVLITFKPMVVFTTCLKHKALTGHSPWSW